MLEYHQAPEFSREKFIFDGWHLTVVENFAGMTKEQKIRVTQIASITTSTTRLWRYSLLPLMCAVILWGLCWILSLVYSPPSYVMAFPLIFGAVFFLYSVHGLTPIEVCVVYEKNGRVFCRIYRPRKRAIAYEEFVAALKRESKIGHATESDVP